MWTIEQDNDTGPDDEGFHEWWDVSDGKRSYRCTSQDDAEFLRTALSAVRADAAELAKKCKTLAEDMAVELVASVAKGKFGQAASRKELYDTLEALAFAPQNPTKPK